MKMTKELLDILNQVQELSEEVRKALGLRTLKAPAQVVGLFMFAKAYKSFRAAVLLFRNGFWQDAATIARTVQELSFQAKWLSKDAEPRARLFVKGIEHGRLRLLNALSKGGGETGIEADALSQALKASEDIEKAWRHWWADESNIEQLAREVDYERVYDLQYRHLSWFVHSAPIAEKYYVSEELAGRVLSISVDCGPTDSGEHREFAELLMSAGASALADVLAVVDSIFQLERQSDFDRLLDAFKKFTALDSGRFQRN